MRTQKSRDGYLVIDHRASPGLPEDVARKSGYDPKHCGEGGLFEAATMTCSHCKVSVVKNPLRTRERASCAKCGYHYICDFCAADAQRADYDHMPFDKLIDVGLTMAERGTPLGSPQQLLMP